MRAHFAGDVVVSGASDAAEVDRIESEPLEARIDDFKRDSKNMEALTEFIDDVLQKAEVEAVKQQQGKGGAKNGKGSQQVTMEQFLQSLDMMRNGCAPKFKIPTDVLDRARTGDFTDDIPDLKCYMKCIATLAGTMTKKGELSPQKAKAQAKIILPPELQEIGVAAMEACVDKRFSMPDFKNGKVVNRARGLVVRIFDAICNCANTAAAAPAQRLKLRGKRSASTANGSGGGAGINDGIDKNADGGASGEKTEVKEKQKKQGNGGGGKDKKNKEDHKDAE